MFRPPIVMTLKRIKLSNIQCHKELDIELPATGVIAFTGNNSNGKSVLTKVLKCLLSNQFQSRPKVRASLINRNAPYGEVLFVRDDDATMRLHLTRDAASTYVSVKWPDSEPVTRYLADKCFQDLCRDFGWHYTAERDVSLNIAELDDQLLFFATSYGCNYDILETAMSDPIASESLQRVQLVAKEAVDIREKAVGRINTCNTVIKSMTLYDMEKEQQRYDSLSEIYNVLSMVYIPTIPEVVPVPDVTIYSVHHPVIPPVVYPEFYDVSICIPDISQLADEIRMLQNKVCPLCKRRFIEHVEGEDSVCIRPA